MKPIAAPDSNIVNFFELESQPLNDAYITIGNFDGVHLGHQAIIKVMLQKAQQRNNPVIVVTFFPNPSDFFNRQSKTLYLSSPEEKEVQLLASGVHSVFTFEFDQAFSKLSPKAFLGGLKEKLGLHRLFVGRDFALGKDRKGDLPVIEAIGRDLSFFVNPIDLVKIGEEEISSTFIRQSLEAGDVGLVSKMLGRNYAISGTVVHGSERGSRIGLPTTNLEVWPKKKLPAVGVYATRVIFEGQTFYGITNVGYRPTFEVQAHPNIETHILDFEGDIYGEQLELQFVLKIRDEQKFEDAEAFMNQIERDKATARKIFADEKS